MWIVKLHQLSTSRCNFSGICPYQLFCDCNWIQTQNQLVRKQTLNHLAKLTKWLSYVLSTYLYGAFIWLYVLVMSCKHLTFRQVWIHSEMRMWHDKNIQSVISSLSKSYIYIWFHWNYCISLSNEFGTNLFCSSVKIKVKAENLLSIFGTKYSKVDSFAVVGVINTEIFIKLPFYKQVIPNNLMFCFLGTLFWAPIPVSQYKIRSGYGPAVFPLISAPLHLLNFETVRCGAY